MTETLYQHQRTELAHLCRTTTHRLMFWQMGTGKTPVVAKFGQTIEGPKLYLCPASCKVQVARELIRWGGPACVQILEGRSAKLEAGAEWCIVNYDLLRSPAIFAQLIAWRWCLGVFDESHMLRNLSAKRTRLVFGNSHCLADQCDRVICLSGTPVIASPADLFPAINRLIPRAIAIDDRRMQFAEFCSRYCLFRTVPIGGGRTVQQPAGGQNLRELRERLAPHMSRLRRQDVLDLPPLRLHEFALSVSNSAELTTALKDLPKALRAALEAAADDDLLPLLRQHTAELATLRRVLGVAKATAAADHIAERIAGGEDRAVAFFHHRDVADVMAAQLRLASIGVSVIRGDTLPLARQQLIDAFDAGKLPVLLLQSQSGSLGLNLQSCRYAAVVEPDWTAAVTEQAVARLYRAGQTRDVEIHFLYVPDSLDEHVVRVARGKAAVAAELIEQPEET